MQSHLNKEDRKTIGYCLTLSWSFSEIGKRIKRDRSVISREINRNGGEEEEHENEKKNEEWSNFVA